jgi:trimethylamine--corrinoid protein Co-methyltransferase
MKAIAGEKPRPLPKRRRASARAARHAMRKSDSGRKHAVRAGMPGGSYKPLRARDLQRIHRSALEVLNTVGIAGATFRWRE